MPVVVNKHHHAPTPLDVYVGRKPDGIGVFGNPYSHRTDTVPGVIKVATRQQAIYCYEQWMIQRLEQGDKAFISALLAIPRNAVLVCWCSPSACHGQLLADFVEGFYAALDTRKAQRV